MLPNWSVALVALVYLIALFAVAHAGDRRGRAFMSGRLRPLIYALTIGVYCTSWTFLGSVGLASRSGWDFLAIYLGPVLVFLLGPALLSRIVALAKVQNSTSIADFIAARFGKSQTVAVSVTFICILGGLPYIALQLKAISSSIEVFLSHGTDGTLIGTMAPGTVPIFGDLSLVIAQILAFFAIAFGTRHIDATENQNGLMLAIAAESAVKLVAFLALGLFVVAGMFGGLEALLARAAAQPGLLAPFEQPPELLTFATMTALSAGAILLLPRQFHVTVVENREAGDIRSARWLFPAYLVAINIFVVPIAIAGLVTFSPGTVDRDMTVIALPLWQGSGLMAVVALIGGLSAATAMVVVESVALAIMVSNHLVVPLVLRRRGGDGSPTTDMGALIVTVRRLAIVALLLLSYIYYRSSSEAALASIGLLAFAAIAQIVPAFVGGLYWRAANARGAVAGLLVGLACWAYTMLLPSLAVPGSALAELAAHGPLGNGWLVPTDMLGMELTPLVHGVVLSLACNTLAFIVGSLSRNATPIEALQADAFLGSGRPVVGEGMRLGRATVTVADLQATVSRYLGQERASKAFEQFHASSGLPNDGRRYADGHLLRFSEHLLSSAIGAASARLVLSLMLRRRNVSPRAAMRLLDDASAAIHYNRNILQNALDHARQGVTVFDSNLRLVAWNQAFQDIYALPQDLMKIGTGLDEIISDNAARGVYGEGRVDDFVAERIDSLVNVREPVRLKLHPGGRVMEIRTNPLPDGGLVTTYTDITEAVEAEQALERRVQERTEELTQVNAALARAKGEAEDANLSKTRFLAAASHDILQPLNAARLYATSLVERTPDGKQADLARNVDASLDAVEEILTALLDISRLDSGTMRPDVTAFRIDDILKQLALEFEPIARAKNLSLTFVPCSLSVRSDRRLLRRLLQNLVSNAIKYTPEGRVLVGCRRRGTKLCICVHDTGLGIPPSKQREVFREFQRLERGARAARGLGLGLSIVERIGRVLDHAVTLRSAEGHGSVFSVDVPLAAEAVAPAGRAEQPQRQSAPLAGLDVICVDNEPAILDGMRHLLEGWGCTVLTASNGAEALAALARSRLPVLVADYHLDEGDGLDVIALLRGEAGVDLPAALLTADRSQPVRERAAAMDVVVLNKPLKPAALRAQLTQWRLTAPLPQAAE